MKTVRVRAPAKVNLHLEVLRHRPDGYHDVETVMQTVDLFDELRVTLLETRPGGEPTIELDVRPQGAAPADTTNLAWRAARLFCDRRRRTGRLRIELEKEIPAAAGLGGGSSDAMAVLVALDRLFGTRLDASELAEMGRELGTDVPFFAVGGTALGRGRGWKLTALPAIRSGCFLIVKPDKGLSTSEVYSSLKMGLTVRPPVGNIQLIKPLIARFPTSSWFGYNRLEEVVLPAHPELKRELLALREEAPIAMLSGSGSAFFAVFMQRDQAERVAESYESRYPYVRCVTPHPGGARVQEG